MRRFGIAVAALAAVLAAPTQAADVRVGKGNPVAFTFIPIDVCVESGICKKHGLDVQISSFAGATRIHQGMAADQIDIGLASGPDMVFVAKGSPVKAVANMAGPPLLIGLGVRPDGSVKSVADLKGQTLGVTTLGSLTWWLARELSKQQGWGPEGIKTIELGTDTGIIAALKTKQIAGTVVGIDMIYNLEDKGEAKLLLNFGDIVKDFMMHVIYATDKYIAKDPASIRAFLVAWFETIQYMKTHKPETIAIYKRVSKIPDAIADKSYDTVMPIFTTDGHFIQSQLDVLAKSYVELKQIDHEPDMRKLLTEAFLPKGRGS
jgi:NitT/TauT family transport system substrate-binding protein